MCRCIVDLSSKEREGGEVAGVWGNGEQLILQLDEGSLKLIETETGETLNCQVLDHKKNSPHSHILSNPQSTQSTYPHIIYILIYPDV